MRILLIDPPFKRFTGFANFYFPIGLSYVGAILEKAGHHVAILDVDAIKQTTGLDFSDEYNKLELYKQGINNDTHPVWQEIEKILSEWCPDLVGITAMTPKIGSVIKTAQLVKKVNPNCPVVVGGPHATLQPELTMKCSAIDVVVKGEAENVIAKLVAALQSKNDLSTIQGISYRLSNRVIHNQPAELLADLDQVPFPGRHLLMNPENYSSENMGVIMTSRGCPYNCSYCCHLWGRKVHNRSINNIINEIKLVIEKFGTTQFEFKDDSFTADRQRIMNLCDTLMNENIKINWGCSTRVNLLDEQLARKMKLAGCNVIKLGIETGSQRILDKTDKGITFAQVRQTAKLLNRLGIFWSGYFMFGLPTETEEDMQKTYHFMKEINPYYAGLGVYNPFPKTKLFDEAVALGLLYPEVELDHFFKTNPKDYFFKDPDKRVLNMSKEKFEEISKMMSRQFHRHNTKLINLLRRGWARRLVYKRSPAVFYADIKKVLQWV